MKLSLRFSILAFFLLSACATNLTTPTSTPKPTEAPSTKTPLPQPTNTALPIVLPACVTDSITRIREGPGTEYEIIGRMVRGTCISVVGRNDDSTWAYIIADDNTRGWVAASLLTIEGDLSSVSVQSVSEVLTLAPTATIVPTQTPSPTATLTPIVYFTSTLPPVPTPSGLLCSDTANKVGEYVSCEITRAYCDYFPATGSGLTLCYDQPYPNQKFTLVVFGEDWIQYDGYCMMVSGTVTLYRGVPQILVTSRSQVSLCK